MATKVVMEALSPTMEEGRLVKWLKNEGDAVKSGEALAEVETDKAIMELVARADGVLRKRLVNEGEARPVGDLVGVIAGADEDISALVGGAGGGAAPPKPAAQAQAGGEARGGAAPAETVITEGREQAGANAIPGSPEESQGDASMPPQEKAPAGGGQPAPPPRGAGTPAPATEQAAHGD